MFRFTIRDVLWLMVVVGCCIAWWVDRSRLAESVATYEKSIDATKLYDEINPNWRKDTADYLRQEGFVKPESPE
jgi:hypothetical protein